MSHEASGNRAIKAHYLLGLARVDLHELVFTPAISRGHRESSDKLKTRLITVYELEGCRRFEEENFIDAKIDADDLNVALQKANLTISALKEKSHKDLCNPEQISRLKFQRGLSCLNGLHRVRAAQTFLDPNDRWWIVRLYSQENFDNDLSTRLLESYGNEQSYTDGIIFRHIRRYHIDGDEVNENRWWARLTLTKRKDLRQLCKNRLLIEAFDRLIPFPGLWTPIQLGTLHRLHGLRCPEELAHYLDHVWKVWSKIVPIEVRHHVDTDTVSLLELFAPGLSTADASSVDSLMKQKRIFPLLDDLHDRDDIRTAVKGLKCLIPSLRTFFENQKYIEPCCSILRKLLGEEDRKRSLWRAFSANYFEPEKFVIQSMEGGVQTLDLLQSSRKGLAYTQLWMFCLRHFPEMTSITPKLSSRTKEISDEKEEQDDEGGSRKQKLNPALWHRLGKLAVDLGFRTDQALEYAARDPDKDHASRFLLAARPDWSGDLGQCIDSVANILSGMEETSSSPPHPVFTSKIKIPRHHRSGKPRNDDHMRDKPNLFVPLFYEDIGDVGMHVTSLFIKRDMLHAFLGGHLDQAVSCLTRFVSSQQYGTPRNETTITRQGYVSETRILQHRLQSQIDFLRATLDTQNAEIDRLRSTESITTAVNAEKLQLHLENKRLQERLQDEQRETAQLMHTQIQFAALQSTNEELQESERQLQANLTNARSEKQAEERKVATLRSDMLLQKDIYTAKLDEQTTRIQVLMKDLDCLRGRLEHFEIPQQTISEGALFDSPEQDEIDQLKEHISTLELEKKRLTDLASGSQVQISENDNLKVTIESLKSQLSTFQNDTSAASNRTTDPPNRAVDQLGYDLFALLDTQPKRLPQKHLSRHSMAHYSEDYELSFLFHTLERGKYQQVAETCKVDKALITNPTSALTQFTTLEAVIIVEDDRTPGFRSMRIFVEDSDLEHFAKQLDLLIKKEKPAHIYANPRFLQYKRITDTNIERPLLEAHRIRRDTLLIGLEKDTKAFLKFIRLKPRKRQLDGESYLVSREYIGTHIDMVDHRADDASAQPLRLTQEDSAASGQLVLWNKQRTSVEATNEQQEDESSAEQEQTRRYKRPTYERLQRDDGEVVMSEINSMQDLQSDEEL